MAVCKYGSISKAADKLLVSRPAVSRAVKDLEQEFGIELFRRTTSGVALTEAGIVFYDKCMKIEKMMAELRPEMEAIKDSYSFETDHLLNIGLTFTARCRILPFLSDFTKKYPHARLKLPDIGVSFLDNSIFDPELDILISLSHKEIEDGLDYIDIEESDFTFCCSKNHPLAQCESVSIYDIKNEPLIELSGLDPRHNQTTNLYSAHGLSPNIVHETTQVSSAKQMIRENLCSSLLPRQSLENDPDIATVPIREVEHICLRIIWNREIRHKKVFYEFINFAREYYGK